MSSRRNLILTTLAVVVVIGAAIVVVASAISTSSARVTASTTGSSFFAAGTIDLRQPDSAVELLFDTDGLYPGTEATGCVLIEYNGSLPSNVRLHASMQGGTGLEEFVELELRLDEGGSCEGQAARGALLFAGVLDRLWTNHPAYDRGLELVAAMAPTERIALHAVARVVDDNAAQGLTTDFTITIEARP